MPSPLLPWELIERVIGHSGGHRETLRRFSLTCRNLRPRALCLLVADVHFKSRDQIFDFCDFLQANPHLKTLVCSITVKPGDFAPFPLLSVLPNLSKLKFYPPPNTRQQDRKAVTVLNRSTIACCKSLGTNIQALHLSQLSFPTFLDFARLLLMFANLTDLCCSCVVIGTKGSQAHVDGMKRRLSNQLHLSTLAIDFPDIGVAKDRKLSVATMFLDASVVQSTVETLIVHGPSKLCEVLHPSTWPQLRTLVLKLEFPHFSVPDAIAALKDFPLSTLKDITVELHCSSIWDVSSKLFDNLSLGVELEQTLLRFPRPKVIIVLHHLRLGRSSFCTQELKQHFPVLLQRGAFKVIFPAVMSGAGHDYPVSALATSPDGKRVATGSFDSTIILWDAANGAVVQEWVAHSYKPVRSLAFSPDSRFLVSGGMHDSNVKIWDIAVGLREVTTLKGHIDHVTSYAWSPHGEMIASGSYDATVRLWDSRTFSELCVLQHPGGMHARFVVFSPDGRWLASGSDRSCNVWNVSGMQHKSLQANLTFKLDGYGSIFAFSPGSTRLLVTAYRGVKLVDVETGEELAGLRELGKITDVAFSPDGTLFLTASGDGMVILWNADTGAKKLTLQGHKKRVNRACFSPCGKYVASGSVDGTVRLWRTKDGSCVATFSDPNRPGWVHCVAFCPDGETLWSGDEDGTVVMRRMRDIVPLNEQAY